MEFSTFANVFSTDFMAIYTVGCKRDVRNQDFGFHFTFRPQVFFRPQILALSPLKESQQRRNQDHSKALALKIEIDMPYALVEPREAYPREKSIFVHVSLTGSCTGFQLTCCALLGTVKNTIQAVKSFLRLSSFEGTGRPELKMKTMLPLLEQADASTIQAFPFLQRSPIEEMILLLEFNT